MKKKYIDLLTYILLILAAIGWFLNVFKLFEGAITETFFRFLGVFIIPMGAIIGWF